MTLRRGASTWKTVTRTTSRALSVHSVGSPICAQMSLGCAAGPLCGNFCVVLFIFDLGRVTGRKNERAQKKVWLQKEFHGQRAESRRPWAERSAGDLETSSMKCFQQHRGGKCEFASQAAVQMKQLEQA